MIELGKYEFLNLAKEWLTINELCMLDSAFCSHISRKTLLHNISQDFVTFHGLSVSVNDTFINWLFLRDVKVNGLVTPRGCRLVFEMKENSYGVLKPKYKLKWST
jgi:hypothetical protein